MSVSLLTPDLRRILAELTRRVGILERRATGKPTTATSDHSHLGLGNDSVVVDDVSHPAVAGGVSSVAIGDSAQVTADRGLAVGAHAQANGEASVAIGCGESDTSGPLANPVGAVAIGAADDPANNGARATGGVSVAIGGAGVTGAGANAAGIAAVAVGSEASVTSSGADGVAIGYQSYVNHARAVALGYTASSTAADQVNLGGNRLFAGCPASLPSGGHLIASQVTISVNESTNLLTFTVKYANGSTVKAGTVALV